MRIQFLQAKQDIAKNKLVTDPFIRGDNRFKEILGYISNWTIDKIKTEELLATDFEEYYCSLKINFKLPCKHLISKTRPIPLAIINKRWLLERPIISSFIKSSDIIS